LSKVNSRFLCIHTGYAEGVGKVSLRFNNPNKATGSKTVFCLEKVMKDLFLATIAQCYSLKVESTLILLCTMCNKLSGKSLRLAERKMYVWVSRGI
jgi:hypothetical protein